MVYFVPVSCWAGRRDLPPGVEPDRSVRRAWVARIGLRWWSGSEPCSWGDKPRHAEVLMLISSGVGEKFKNGARRQGSGRRWQHDQRTGSRLTRSKEDLGQVHKRQGGTWDLACVSWVRESQTQSTSFFCSQKNKPSHWRQIYLICIFNMCSGTGYRVSDKCE